MPAMDALQMKAVLFEDLADANMIRGLGGFVDSVEGRDPDGATPNPGTFDPGMDGPKLAERWRLWLSAGYTFYVAPTMQTLVTAAAESMPQEHLVPSDLPAAQGFLWIPGGLASIDINGNLLKHNALLWSAYGSQVEVVWFCDKTDPEDSGNIQMRAQFGEADFNRLQRLTVNHVSHMVFGEPLPQKVGLSALRPEGVEVKIVHTETPDGVEIQMLARGEGAEEWGAIASVQANSDPILRWLLACWRLMQQTVTNVVEETAPRPLRRQLERVKLNDRAVTVIQLRQRAGEYHADGEGREWSHQWLVRGHWRNQPCKDTDGAWTSRLVWIHPYVKGPEDKPLLVRDHVYSLVR